MRLLIFTIALISAFNLNAQLPGSGNAYDFSSNHITIQNYSAINPDYITLEAWIKADSWATNIWENVIISKDGWAAGEQGYTLRAGANGSLSFNVGTIGSWHEVASGPVMSIGQWYHVAGTFDGAMMRLYINGEEVNNAPLANVIAQGSYDLTIGRIAFTSGGTRYFDGMIDEVRIWEDPLPQSSLQDFMCKKVTASHPQYASLVGYWNFDGATVDDLSMNTPIAGTVVGATQTPSGAAIGDQSVHSYAAPVNLSIDYMGIDSIEVTTSTTMSTVHLYRVDAGPTDVSLGGTLDSIDQTHYYGIFSANSAAYNYDLTYHYGTNPMSVGFESYLDIAGRNNGTISPWDNLVATVNIPASEIDKTLSERQEVVLGIACPSVAMNLSGPQTICSDDMVTMVNQGNYSTIQWYDGATAITGATNDTLMVNTSGNYYFMGTDGTCSGTSDTIDVTVNMIPAVDFGTVDTMLCEDDGFAAVTGGSPAGGTYSGLGMFGTNFVPGTAGLGTHTLYYDYTDANGCSNTDSVNVSVNPTPVAPVIVNNGTEICVTNGSTSCNYVWMLDATVIPGATDTCIAITTNGDYSVICTSAEGCESDMATVTVSNVGIEEYAWSQNMSISPNPTSGIVIIEVNTPLSMDLKLLNAQGAVILNSSLNGTSATIDLSDFSTGIYLLQISTQGESIVRRIVKE